MEMKNPLNISLTPSITMKRFVTYGANQKGNKTLVNAASAEAPTIPLGLSTSGRWILGKRSSR